MTSKENGYNNGPSVFKICLAWLSVIVIPITARCSPSSPKICLIIPQPFYCNAVQESKLYRIPNVAWSLSVLWSSGPLVPLRGQRILPSNAARFLLADNISCFLLLLITFLFCCRIVPLSPVTKVHLFSPHFCYCILYKIIFQEEYLSLSSIYTIFGSLCAFIYITLSL